MVGEGVFMLFADNERLLTLRLMNECWLVKLLPVPRTVESGCSFVRSRVRGREGLVLLLDLILFG